MKTQSIRKLYSHIKLSVWTPPAAIFLVGLVTYGVLLPWLGFYWDDWAKIGVAKLHGLSGYWNYYLEDRPLSSWTHILFTPLLGTQPLTWQIFQFCLTLMTSWGIYWFLISMFPRGRYQAAAVSLLFLIYPVFTQHSTAVTFHQQWLQYFFFLLSLGLMLSAERSRQKSQTRFAVFTSLSLITALLQLSVTEYFASLELIRPFLFWQLLESADAQSLSIKKRLGLVFWRCAPYLAVLVFYGVWRMYLQPFPSGDPYRMVTVYGILSSPIAALQSLLVTALRDSLHILISVWGPLFVFGSLESISPFQYVALALCVVAGGITYFILSYEDIYVDHTDTLISSIKAWHQPVLWMGIVAFFLGMLPAWLTGRSVLDDFHSDRYALPAMFGASMIWVSFINWLAPGKTQRALVFAILVIMGANLQLRTSNEYRWLWHDQTQFFWQLYWRAPYLEPGTALLSYQEIFPNQGLFSSSSALNLLYPNIPKRKDAPDQLNYWWYTLAPRYDINQLSEPINLTFSTQFRSYKFKGQTPNTLIVHYDLSHGNCLWVITEKDQTVPGLPELVKTMSSISNIDRIHSAPFENWRPSEDLFGPEPAHTWCYLYAKAELARQNRDWKTINALGEQALAMGYSPEDSRSNSPHEWMPFIEGFAHLGKWKEATEISYQIIMKGKEFHPELIILWQDLASIFNDGSAKQSALNDIYHWLH